MTEMLVLPFYVVVDVSYSMTMPQKNSADGRTPLQAGNDIVKEVKSALDVAPILSDKIRFSLVDFSDDAQVVIPMCDLSRVETNDIPVLAPRGGTSFAAAFTLLKQQISIDVAQLKADGHKVYRPAVFFLTDGEPSESDAVWKAAFSALTDPSFKERPNVIPFGVADAQKTTLDQLVFPQGKMRSFLAKGDDPSAAIRQMSEKLIGSVLASANSIHSAGTSGGFILTEEDEDDDAWL